MVSYRGAALVLGIILLFVIWHLLPKKVMNVAVLDKTVLSYADDENIIKENVYRKHQGLYWILHQQRYIKPDGEYYDYQRDYFGPKLDEEGNFDGDTEFKDAQSTPDLLYLSDAYGMGNDTYGYYNGGSPLNGGISDDDMSYISFAHESGAPIVAEMAFFSTAAVRFRTRSADRAHRRQSDQVDRQIYRRSGGLHRRSRLGASDV